MRRLRASRQHGLTLVELIVVVAVIGVILVLAAPSMQRMIHMQRLRGVNAQVVTDLQFARAEAVARREFMRMHFQQGSGVSCYTIYTAPDNTNPCECVRGVGAACIATGQKEVRTVQVRNDSGVRLSIPPGRAPHFAFDWRTGGIWTIPTDDEPLPMNRFEVNASLDTPRTLSTRLNAAGRPQVCRPTGSTMPEDACPL